MNDEVGGILNEVVMTKFTVLSCHIPGGIEESHNNNNKKSQGSQCPGQDSNWASPAYKCRALLLDKQVWWEEYYFLLGCDAV
jgi:hypothetical protein